MVFFEYEDKRKFAMAGLWSDEGYCIITSEPRYPVAEVHHRQPVILGPKEAKMWLDPKLDDAGIKYLVRPKRYVGMHFYKVGSFAKKPGYDSPKCVEPDTESD